MWVLASVVYLSVYLFPCLRVNTCALQVCVRADAISNRIKQAIRCRMVVVEEEELVVMEEEEGRRWWW